MLLLAPLFVSECGRLDLGNIILRSRLHVTPVTGILVRDRLQSLCALIEAPDLLADTVLLGFVGLVVGLYLIVDLVGDVAPGRGSQAVRIANTASPVQMGLGETVEPLVPEIETLQVVVAEDLGADAILAEPAAKFGLQAVELTE